MMISNLKKPFGLHGFYKNISALEGLIFKDTQDSREIWQYLRQWYNSLILVIIGGWDIDKHEGFCITPQWVLHQHG